MRAVARALLRHPVPSTRRPRWSQPRCVAGAAIAAPAEACATASGHGATAEAVVADTTPSTADVGSTPADNTKLGMQASGSAAAAEAAGEAGAADPAPKVGAARAGKRPKKAVGEAKEVVSGVVEALSFSAQSKGEGTVVVENYILRTPSGPRELSRTKKGAVPLVFPGEQAELTVRRSAEGDRWTILKGLSKSEPLSDLELRCEVLSVTRTEKAPGRQEWQDWYIVRMQNGATARFFKNVGDNRVGHVCGVGDEVKVRVDPAGRGDAHKLIGLVPPGQYEEIRGRLVLVDRKVVKGDNNTPGGRLSKGWTHVLEDHYSIETRPGITRDLIRALDVIEEPALASAGDTVTVLVHNHVYGSASFVLTMEKE
eukprot:Hpha_TRINITY_DN20089_c0_g1::TRINITY_DN20089_c0_g1_i1::g.147799::m.147799